MATIKSYTDIFQSKKLAEILPLESADMHYEDCEDGFKIHCAPSPFGYEYNIPCWSLAALFNILPNNKYITTTLSRGGWKIEPNEYVDKWWCEYEDDDHTKDFSVSADNPIDACVAMIKKLHELKML